MKAPHEIIIALMACGYSVTLSAQFGHVAVAAIDLSRASAHPVAPPTNTSLVGAMEALAEAVVASNPLGRFARWYDLERTGLKVSAPVISDREVSADGAGRPRKDQLPPGVERPT